MYNFSKRVFSEFLATAFLLLTVVGSGIMGEKLANGNEAIVLLANSLATGAGLIFLIYSFGEISGAQMNPAVSLVEFLRGNLTVKEISGYLAAQVSGAISGVALANFIFGLPIVSLSQKERSGLNLFVSEIAATFGLIAVILTVSKSRPPFVPLAVAAYITSAYWFTSSTSFANPAVTLARSFSDTFAGIKFSDIWLFVAAQIIGSAAAYLVFNWLLREEKR